MTLGNMRANGMRALTRVVSRKRGQFLCTFNLAETRISTIRHV
jgi:hypothetical protein